MIRLLNQTTTFRGVSIVVLNIIIYRDIHVIQGNIAYNILAPTGKLLVLARVSQSSPQPLLVPRLVGFCYYYNRFYANISFSTERLVTDICNPERELNSKVELVISIFENIDFPITMAIVVHDNQDRWLIVIKVIQIKIKKQLTECKTHHLKFNHIRDYKKI